MKLEDATAITIKDGLVGRGNFVWTPHDGNLCRMKVVDFVLLRGLKILFLTECGRAIDPCCTYINRDNAIKDYPEWGEQPTGEADQRDLPCKTLTKGDQVSKVGGDYTFDGEVVAAFTKKSGAQRYVVEDDRGVLHIFSTKNLERRPAVVSSDDQDRFDANWLIAADAPRGLMTWNCLKNPTHQIVKYDLGYYGLVTCQTKGEVRAFCRLIGHGLAGNGSS